jgi:hypothetical protein
MFGIRDPGSEIRDPEKIHPGSRILGVKKHRIPDPDPQHCSRQNLKLYSTGTVPVLFNTVGGVTGRLDHWE